MSNKTGFNQVSNLFGNANNVLNAMLEMSEGRKAMLSDSKPLTRRFTQKEASELVGRERITITRAQEAGKLSKPEKDSKTNRSMGMTLAQIIEAQELFGTSPGRDKDTDDCMVFASINFKGGVGKTETASNLARFLAMKGYKGCLIDLDSQGSASSGFGYIPDIDFSESDTVLPYLYKQKEDLKYALHETHWPNLKLIPACMALHSAEFDLVIEAINMDQQSSKIEFYKELSRGIDTIKEEFDFIIIDSPPSLSVTSISILLAADALVIPTSPAKHDFSSTVQFLKLVKDVLQNLAPGKEYKFAKVLVTKFMKSGYNDIDFYQMMRDTLEDAVYPKVFKHMTAIKDASAEFTTVYEMKGVKKHVYDELQEVFGQIENDMLASWPSKTGTAISQDMAV